MKAKINNGKRGKKIETLLKRYEDEMRYPSDYFDYIDASYLNGNFTQVIELFNDMKHEQQITYLGEYALDGARLLIIRNL